MKLRELWWIAQGLWYCTYKGVKLAVLRLPVSKRDKLENSWGFHDDELHGYFYSPDLGRHYVRRDDVWLDQTTLPRGSISHHRTDLIVEWCNLSAQRGAKFLCALYPVFFLLGFGLAWWIM